MRKYIYFLIVLDQGDGLAKLFCSYVGLTVNLDYKMIALPTELPVTENSTEQNMLL